MSDRVEVCPEFPDIGFEKIKADAMAEIANSKTLEELDAVRLKYLGKRGIITIMLREFVRSLD